MNHAIVMGGSIAGLCAAAGLSENFDRVTVLERDPQPGLATRKGAGQRNHTHVLLYRGQAAMETLIPKAFVLLKEMGAKNADACAGVDWFQHGAWKATVDSGAPIWMQSRPLLEHCLHEGLKDHTNIEFRYENSVEEALHENGRVRGVRLSNGEVIEGDLVVDATGRGSRSTKWLEKWGYGKVSTQEVTIGLRYVSGVFDLPAGHVAETATVVSSFPPHNRRCGWVFPIEGNRVIITQTGYHGDHPPMDIEGFRQWARTLLQPNISNILEVSTLVGEIKQFNFPRQIRRVYSQKLNLPENYLVMGDAICSFDPTFGQGMTVVALQAELLKNLRPGDSTSKWQRRFGRMSWLPFSTTSNEAFRWEQTTGWKPPMSAIQRWYLGRVFNASNVNTQVYQRLIDVMHFRVSPFSLFRPSLVWKVLRTARIERKQPRNDDRVEALGAEASMSLLRSSI